MIINFTVEDEQELSALESEFAQWNWSANARFICAVYVSSIKQVFYYENINLANGKHGWIPTLQV